MNASLDINRTFLPFGFRSEYETSAPSSPENVKALAHSLIDKCVTRSLIREAELRDVKGRDPNLVLIEGTPQKLKPSGHELLFLHGTAPSNILDEPNSERDGDEIEDWSFAIHTPFKEFEGAHHIRHQVVPQFNLLDRDQLLQALESEQTKVSLLRFGFDIFKSQRFLSMIGFIPSSVRTVLVDANEQELRFKIFAEDLKRRDESPFTLVDECQFWSTLSTGLLKFGDFNPEAAYLRALVK